MMSDLRAPANPIADIYRVHDNLRAQYGKLKEAHGLLDKVREEMDGLLKLGDTVTKDDVIKGSGRLVGHGIGSAQMAEILATMPAADGAPLSEWVLHRDIEIRQREAQMQLIRNQVQHQLAVAGMKVVAAEHLRGAGTPAPAASAAPVQSGAMTLQGPQQTPQQGE